MTTVKCPSCGEKGPIPKHLVGMRIKCRKCGTPFLVTAPAARAASPSASAVMAGALVPEAAALRPDTIEVDGLDDTAWSAPAVVTAGPEHDHHHDHDPDEAASAFTASPAAPPAPAPEARQYKILTPKDKYFDNKFDLTRLEDALNHYAKQGWVVRSMATPHITGFSGGAREELVILLER